MCKASLWNVDFDKGGKMRMKRLTRPIDHAYYGPIEERLLDIEDILGDEYDLDRLRELAQADRVGRCVVLPCARNEKIYILGPDIQEWKILHPSVTFTKHDGGEMEHCPLDIITSSIGKTVFLTREEAEATLRREHDD